MFFTPKNSIVTTSVTLLMWKAACVDIMAGIRVLQPRPMIGEKFTGNHTLPKKKLTGVSWKSKNGKAEDASRSLAQLVESIPH